MPLILGAIVAATMTMCAGGGLAIYCLTKGANTTNWHTVLAPNKRWSIKMPGVPETAPSPKGDADTKRYVFRSPGRSAEFSAIVLDSNTKTKRQAPLDDGPDFQLVSALMLIEVGKPYGVNADAARMRTISREGRPGIEFESMTGAWGTVVVRVIGLTYGNDAIVVTMCTAGRDVTAAERQAFFDSLAKSDPR